MNAKQRARKVAFTPAQRAEQHRIRALFQDWHPSPEELIASGEGASFALFGEYSGLRPLLVQLKQARDQAGLSLADVARRCGIDKAALSRLENGQNANPTLDTLWRYAAALGKRLLLGTADIAPTRAAATNTVPPTKGKHVRGR
jgi:DNA-binding XRE family transcriptional regulator